MLAPGDKLGPYIVEAALGAGGMGVVFRARDSRLGRAVAIKLLPAELVRDEAAQQRFLQEAKTASALDHPNICTIYDIDHTPDGQLYLVMACYEGETLKQRLDRGPIPVAEAVDIAVQLLQGLSRSHAAGIVHRDIKPANIMLPRGGPVKILDFGVATLVGANLVTQVHDSGFVVGTLAYMSPEQAMNRPVNLRADLWSAGVVLYEMVAGVRPFLGDTIFALAEAIRTGTPLPLAGAAAAITGVIERALAKDPSQRHRSADEMIRDVRAAIDLSSSTSTTLTTGVETSTARRRSNLPRNLPSLFGRETLVAHAGRELQAAGLVTLAGFGGVGKTRLAQQVGAEAVVSYADGVWFVDLTAVSNDADLLPTIARAIGVKEYASESLDVTLVASLRDSSMLVILDTCEQLVEAVAAVVEQVTAAAPQVKFLATSRTPLGVYGECVIRVEGLDEAAATALFAARAAQARAGISVDCGIVAELCRRLDFLPLAIELAAARVRSMTPEEILHRLDERFRMLRATDRRAARHQTLESMVDWSYGLLPDQERELLNRLSVFMGSFDLASAERVCSGDGLDAHDVVDLLDRLVDKSLASAIVARGTTRYRMMETVREYAADRLAEAGRQAEIFDRHVRYFSSRAQTLGDRIRGADMRSASAAVSFDIDNLNAAIDRLGRTGRLAERATLVSALSLYWFTAAPSAGRKRFEELLESLDALEPSVQLATLLEAASLMSNQAFVGPTTARLEQAERTATRFGLDLPPYFYYVGATVAEMDGRIDDVMRLCAAGTSRVKDGDEFIALALRTRVLTSIAKLHPNEAIPHARETLRQAEALALDLFIAVSHMLIGTVHVLQDRLAESEPEFADAIAVAGDALPQVAIAAKAAAASGYRGVDVARSIALAREAIVIEERADIMPVFRAIAADLIAWHRARTGALEDTVTALAAIDALRARLGFAGIWWAEPIRHEAWAAARAALPAARVDELAARGKTMAAVDLRKLLLTD